MKNKKVNIAETSEKHVLNKNIIIVKRIIKYLLLFAQIVTPILSVYVIWKTNTLTNTANLLQINNAIQQRYDILNSIEFEIEEFDLLSKNNNTDDEDKAWLLYQKRLSAIKAYLNTYEFACQQYDNNKIDKAAFKLFFSEIIKFLKEDEKYGIYLMYEGDIV